MGKYSRLAKYLFEVKEDDITLSFDEVKRILGFPLPNSAFKYNPWWSNDRTHVQAEDGWMKVGWKVDKIDIQRQEVSFTRYRKINKYPIEEITKTNRKNITSQEFEEIARQVMADYFEFKEPDELSPGKVPGFPKLFDFVSPDKKIVGDAKYLTMVRGKRIPPAKFSTIAEYVWMLEKTDARVKFIVFGNDRRVPEEWLVRYGKLVSEVRFFFLELKDRIPEELILKQTRDLRGNLVTKIGGEKRRKEEDFYENPNTIKRRKNRG